MRFNCVVMPPGDTNSDGSPCTQRSDIILLDGGFSSQLSCHVEKPIDGDVLWTSRYLATHPESVIETHLDFLAAGSDVILTNTYQASVGAFMEHLHMSEEEAYDLIKKAVRLAQEARDRYAMEYMHMGNKKPLIAGSVGPYGASLHDGSEYTGAYADTISPETIKEWHRPRISALVESGVDLLALETIPCLLEAEILMDLIKEYPNMKAWLSFSCSQDGTSTAYGEDFREAIRGCYKRNPEQLVALGANCLAPRLVEPLLTGLGGSIPLIVYPNSGENYNVEKGWIDRDKCEPLETYVHKWLDLGVKYIGGCCRTYAADVTRIGLEMRQWERAQYKKQE